MHAFLLSLALAVAPGGGAAQQAVQVQGEGSGAAYQQLLLSAVRQADRVVLTEHSNQYDASDPVTGVSNGPYHVYASHQLSDDERRRLMDAIAAADARASQAPMCLFSPHHAIDFYIGERRDSRLEICLTCGEIEWDAVHAMYPRALIRVFKQLVAQSGMQAERNWPRYLQQAQTSQ